jgi:type VI secretion system protein ImpK
MGATLFGATPIKPAGSSGKRRPENLALLFQEILTVIVRVRSNRQPVTDAQKFRADMRGALKNAEKDAITRAYLPDDVRLATFAVVAFLDESVLNSSNPAFADWARMPLQEEMYGHQLAGETFFHNIDSMLSRTDSHELADVLEVYLICLLLGYRGRYDLSSQEGLRPVIDSVTEKMRRIRGPMQGLSPAWAVPEGPVTSGQADPWIHRLMLSAIISLGLALVLFVLFKVLLAAGDSGLRAMASQIH